MTVKQLIAMLQELPEDQQNLPIGKNSTDYTEAYLCGDKIYPYVGFIVKDKHDCFIIIEENEIKFYKDDVEAIKQCISENKVLVW